MILWLNGPFGVGKSVVAAALLEARPEWTVFDTELIGDALERALSPHHPVPDFQDRPAWRRLTARAVAEVAEEMQTVVVVPQTVLVEEYWLELTQSLAARDLPVVAVTLHADGLEHSRRIATDRVEVAAASWRASRRADYDRARPWLNARTHVLDTTQSTPSATARAVLDLVPATA